LATSFPKHLDTLYGACEVSEVTDDSYMVRKRSRT